MVVPGPSESAGFLQVRVPSICMYQLGFSRGHTSWIEWRLAAAGSGADVREAAAGVSSHGLSECFTITEICTASRPSPTGRRVDETSRPDGQFVGYLESIHAAHRAKRNFIQLLDEARWSWRHDGHDRFLRRPLRGDLTGRSRCWRLAERPDSHCRLSASAHAPTTSSTAYA